MDERGPGSNRRRVAATERNSANRSLFSASRDRSLMALAHDTAHDVRGLLNVIAMNVELLARAAEAGPGTSPLRTRPGRSAEVVRRELRRLDQLLNVLLGARTIEHDSPEMFDLAEVCRMLTDLVAARASRQHVDMTCAVPAGAMLFGFPDRIHAAILGLMVNALDAMPEGGRLSVSLSPAEDVLVRVCDTGPGIPATLLKEVWAPGFTTRAGGSGLGLHVARIAIESHGGTIRYEPGPDGGSCFVIELPRAVHH